MTKKNKVIHDKILIYLIIKYDVSITADGHIVIPALYRNQAYSIKYLIWPELMQSTYLIIDYGRQDS
jgi:hypothetical protein